MYSRRIKLIIGALMLGVAIAITFLPPRTGAQKSGDATKKSSKIILDARAKRQLLSQRKIILSDSSDGQAKTTKRVQIDKRQTGLASNTQFESRQQQSAATTTASNNLRLTFRDIGPETGFTGAGLGLTGTIFFDDVEVDRIDMPFSSGTSFVFNRDTKQLILPTSQRIFKSVSSGLNWSPVDMLEREQLQPIGAREGTYFVRQDRRNPNVLHVVCSHLGRLFRSTDFGATWTQLEDFHPTGLSQTNFADVAVHEASSNVVLALKRSPDEFQGPALWRSEDGGATFTPQWETGLPQGLCEEDNCFLPTYSTIATTPADPNIVYVVQDFEGDGLHPRGIWKSIDGGLTFSFLDASPSGVFQVFPHPTRPGVLFAQNLDPFTFDSWIYRSMDGGASFQLVTNGLTRENFFVSFDRRYSSLVYVAGRGGVFRSQDGGETFQPLGLAAQQRGRFATNVNVDPSDSNVIYVNTFNGNFKSTNGGKTFAAINNGWKAVQIRSIEFDNSDTPDLYLTTANGIMRTNTRGRSYESVSDCQQSTTIFFDDFESDPSSRWTIGRESTDPSTFVPRDWTWVHSLPDGRGGSAFFAPDPEAFELCSAPLPGQVGVLLLESPPITLPSDSRGGLGLSFDHWVSVEEGFDGAQLMISVNGGPYSLVAPNASPDFIADGYNFQLFPVEHNNPRFGQSAWSGDFKPWGTTIVDLSRYAKPGDTIRLRWDMSTDYCFGTDAGWYVDNVRVYTCLADIGGPAVLNDTQTLAIAPSNPNMIIASTGRGALYRSLDGGQSWTQSIVDTGLVLAGNLTIDPHDFRTVYFAGSQIDNFGEITGFGFYKSVDAGASFARTDPLNFRSIGIDPQDPNIICGVVDCNDCSPVRMSMDGGRTFSSIPGAMTFKSAAVSQLLIDPNDPNNNFVVGRFVLYEDPLVVHHVVRSTDMSITFSPADSGLSGCSLLIMNPKVPSRLYCQNGLGLSITSDSGKTWASVQEDEIFKSTGGLSTDMLMNPKNPNLLYFLGRSLLEMEIHQK